MEFIVSAPPRTVQLAQLITLGINTGQLGDDDPQRPLATIQLVDEGSIPRQRRRCTGVQEREYQIQTLRGPRKRAYRRTPRGVLRRKLPADSGSHYALHSHTILHAGAPGSGSV